MLKLCQKFVAQNFVLFLKCLGGEGFGKHSQIIPVISLEFFPKTSAKDYFKEFLNKTSQDCIFDYFPHMFMFMFNSYLQNFLLKQDLKMKMCLLKMSVCNTKTPEA